MGAGKNMAPVSEQNRELQQPKCWRVNVKSALTAVGSLTMPTLAGWLGTLESTFLRENLRELTTFSLQLKQIMIHFSYPLMKIL